MVYAGLFKNFYAYMYIVYINLIERASRTPGSL